MKVTIYFKDSVDKPAVTVEGLTAIKARNADSKSRDKSYYEGNFQAFMPFPEESYSFTGSGGVISMSGTEILYVEFKED